jgi:hypothetical protein
MGCDCNDSCCPSSGQLCVDASFFVPEFNDCTVNYLYFGVPVAGKNNVVQGGNIDSCIYLTGAGPYTRSANLYWGATGWTNYIVGTVTTTWSANSDSSYLCLSGVSLNGAKLNFGGSTQAHVDMYGGCVPEFVNLIDAFTPTRTTPPRALPTGSNQDVKYDVNLLGTKIGVLTVSQECYQVQPQTGGCCQWACVKVTYGPTNENRYVTGISNNVEYVSESLAGGKKSEKFENQAERIGEACLCLQLRANKNVLNNDAGSSNPDASYFPAGDYELCLTRKNCDGVFDNKSLLRLSLSRNTSGTTLVSYWGRDVDSLYRSKQLTTRDATATICGANVSVCGLVDEVAQNTNDFAVCVENAMQLFDISDIVKGTDAGKVVPSDNLSLNETPTLKARLSNTKLYLTIKYIAIVPVQGQSGDPKPISCCKGSLNPFGPSQGSSGSVVTKVKGFCTCEIVDMNHHSLLGSQISKDITCCVTSEDIMNINNQYPQA